MKLSEKQNTLNIEKKRSTRHRNKVFEIILNARSQSLLMNSLNPKLGRRRKKLGNIKENILSSWLLLFRPFLLIKMINFIKVFSHFNEY